MKTFLLNLIALAIGLVFISNTATAQTATQTSDVSDTLYAKGTDAFGLLDLYEFKRKEYEPSNWNVEGKARPVTIAPFRNGNFFVRCKGGQLYLGELDFDGRMRPIRNLQQVIKITERTAGKPDELGYVLP